jgi:hypothetical protein
MLSPGNFSNPPAAGAEATAFHQANIIIASYFGRSGRGERPASFTMPGTASSRANAMM